VCLVRGKCWNLLVANVLGAEGRAGINTGTGHNSGWPSRVGSSDLLAMVVSPPDSYYSSYSTDICTIV
jgi:hypothetical protein